MGQAEKPSLTPKLEAAYQRYFPVIREKCRRMLSDSLLQKTQGRLARLAPELLP